MIYLTATYTGKCK